MANLPSNLPGLLRDAGLRVVEVDGWRDRGRPGSFAPVGVLCHHTATRKSTSDSAVVRLLRVGRSDLPGPLSQLGLARDGTVYIIAAGRANHAGRAKSSGAVAAGDGNELYIGIEAFNDGVGEPWPAVQREAYELLAAVLSVEVTGNSAQTVRAHRETSITGKIDPRGIDMGDFRVGTAAKMKALTTPPPPPPPPVTTHTRWATRTTGVHATPGGKKLRDIPAGYKFQVVDGSGHGNDGWIETSAGNWVVGADTTTRDPALPSRLSVLTHNVWNGRDWESDVLPTLNGILEKYDPDVPNLQECYEAPDLAGKVPGYAFRYQGYGYEPETPGYIEEHSDCVILVRDGVEVKAKAAYEMTESWAGPKMGIMHDPRIFRRVTVLKDEQIFRVINVHGPFGTAARREFLAWAREEFEALAALGDPVIFIGDWNVSYETLRNAMGPLATVDGGSPDMIAMANCRKHSSVNLGRQGSDTHDCKIWTVEA
ncbi:MAG TPA: N-acetylmuramoyl-L-alanine amidase [Nocardioides sp.]